MAGGQPAPLTSLTPRPMLPWCPGARRTTPSKTASRQQTGPNYCGRWHTMVTSSSAGQGRRKKNPGLMDSISSFFGGDKKKRSKGSFRGHLSTSPQPSVARRRTTENAVVHFFRSMVSSPRPKSRWREVLGLASTPRAESTKSPVRRRREQSTLSRIFNLGEVKSRPPPKRWSTIF